MSHAARHSSTPDASMVGVVSVVMSLLALLSVGWLALVTFERTVPDLSPLLRFAGAAFLPIGLAVGIPSGIAALRYRDVNRVTGTVGLLLGGLAIAAFGYVIASLNR